MSMYDPHKMLLIGHILEGRKNAMTAKILSQKTGLSKRGVGITIELLRKEGHPICSSDSVPMGYFIPATRLEAEQAFRSFDARVRGMFATRKALGNSLNKRFANSCQMELAL